MSLRLKTFIVIYFAGLFGMIAWFVIQAITAFHTTELSDVFMLVILGFLTLTMGYWWLPIVAKITGLRPNPLTEENI